MLKRKVNNLLEYYYQWMCKHKDDADRRLALLRRYEWIPHYVGGHVEYHYCPECNNIKGHGHADGCELAAELKENHNGGNK